ncbi:MAG: hypothetical protein AAGI38_01765 [Bacteroidota bacterium]
MPESSPYLVVPVVSQKAPRIFQYHQLTRVLTLPLGLLFAWGIAFSAGDDFNPWMLLSVLSALGFLATHWLGSFLLNRFWEGNSDGTWLEFHEETLVIWKEKGPVQRVPIHSLHRLRVIDNGHEGLQWNLVRYFSPKPSTVSFEKAGKPQFFQFRIRSASVYRDFHQVLNHWQADFPQVERFRTQSDVPVRDMDS